MKRKLDVPPDGVWHEVRGWYWATDRYILVRNDAPRLTQDDGYSRRWLGPREIGEGRNSIGELLDAVQRSKARPAPPRFMIPTAQISSAGAAAEILLPYAERLGGRCLYFRAAGVPLVGASLPAQRLPLAVIAMARVYPDRGATW